MSVEGGFTVQEPIIGQILLQHILHKTLSEIGLREDQNCFQTCFTPFARLLKSFKTVLKLIGYNLEDNEQK